VLEKSSNAMLAAAHRDEDHDVDRTAAEALAQMHTRSSVSCHGE
jgi:hypothetical protein